MKPADWVDISQALRDVARAIRDLGNGDACTPMGGLEALGQVFKEGLESISISIGSGLTEIAEAIREAKTAAP